MEKEGSLSFYSIDDYLSSAPAAGYRNGSSLNNAGENGNYWSSTPNDTNNAYNLNFNSSNHNTNWNNRNNGQSVRPVSEFTDSFKRFAHHFSISKEQLLQDLYNAYKEARRHKRNKLYQLNFEYSLEENLIKLRDDLFDRKYIPLPSSCFIIHDPKMREVFAADFRDRIVHHLFYHYTYKLFESTFIYDSYSCIKGRGTHFGIERLKHHIRSESLGYSRECYVLKIDIRGYFMSIDRGRLMDICIHSIKRSKFARGLDLSLLYYLLDVIINTNPVVNCRIIGSADDWKGLPREKSLFFSKPGCGLPIGNLSSQLFSNVYLNLLDQFMKRELKCKHYGRYVDDAYVVSSDKNFLKSLIPKISEFLSEELSLQIHPTKTRIYNAYCGFEFLGAYIKPFRTYISSSSLKRIKHKLLNPSYQSIGQVECSVNSFLGVFSHYNSYFLRRELLGYKSPLKTYGRFSDDYLRFIPYIKSDD